MTIVSRTPFTTSRLMEFCTVTELTKLVGAEPADWPRVVLKELVDNSLDACEDAGVAPEIVISVVKDVIAVSDNGPGIAADTVTRLLDYRTKTSSREAYVAPCRGAQGNALQSLLAMPFALDGKSGETTITSRGVTHRINFTIDPVRREPKIEPHQRGSLVQSGTRIACNGRFLLAHIWPRPRPELYKLSATSCGSTRMQPSLCAGTASLCSRRRPPIRHGASGVPAIQLQRRGTTTRVSLA